MKFSSVALALIINQTYSAFGACPYAHLFGNTADEIENPHEDERTNDKIDIKKRGKRFSMKLVSCKPTVVAIFSLLKTFTTKS